MSAPTQSNTNVSVRAPTPQSSEAFPGMSELQEYNIIQFKMKAYRERLKVLTPRVKRVMGTLPSQSFDVGDGKVKLTTTTTFRPMTLPSLKDATLKLILTQSGSAQRSHKKNQDLAEQMAEFLWGQRPQTQIQRLHRTWSTKKAMRRRRAQLAGTIVIPSMNLSDSSTLPRR
jgi:hypothetical protein